MDRRQFLSLIPTLAAGYALRPFPLFGTGHGFDLRRADFGPEFRWGVATSAYQIEGGWNTEGKGPSVWDTFTHRKGKIKDGSTGDIACDFYHRYASDIQLIRQLGIPDFRFSLAWSRILPQGTGTPNSKGLDFYKRLIDECLESGITPWVTLYHWDLPQALEDRGGWQNRDITGWFSDYTDLVTRTFNDRVKHWMVLNEPFAFTTLGYLLGMHAPGKKGLGKYANAIHHTALCQGLGGKLTKANVPDAEVGTTFSVMDLDPYRDKAKDEASVARWDAMLNRLFIEPMLGMGYPSDAAPFCRKVERLMQAGDEDRLEWKPDFIGIQYYTRLVIKALGLVPIVKGIPRKTEKLGLDPGEITEMGWEVYPEGFFNVLKRFAAYPGIRKIYVTENGAAFPDRVENDCIHDPLRTRYIQDHLLQLNRAQQEGVPVDGYFIWTLMDNFEWAEGYHARFGLIHTHFETQERIVKDSGKWFSGFLKE
jgi:beta-glucosidase